MQSIRFYCFTYSLLAILQATCSTVKTVSLKTVLPLIRVYVFMVASMPVKPETCFYFLQFCRFTLNTVCRFPVHQLKRENGFKDIWLNLK
jgi:hypothetical protein